MTGSGSKQIPGASAPARRSSRKPKESPFAKCARKLDAAMLELQREMAKIDPHYPGGVMPMHGHWYMFEYSNGGSAEVFAPGASLALRHAEHAAALFDGLRECCR